MSVTQQQVLDALSKVMSPRGVALPNANVLSAISPRRQSVFLHQCRCRRGKSLGGCSGEGGRCRAGHSRRHLGDDRAHRGTQGRLPPRAAPHPHAPPPHRPWRAAGGRAPAAAGRARRCRAGGNSRASPPSSRSPRARAASANRPPRSTSRSACATLACASGCSMPISTAPRCRG